MNIGIAIDNLNSNEFNKSLTQYCNEWINTDNRHSVNIFLEDIIPTDLLLKVPIFQLYHLYGFYGYVIATNMQLARRILTFPGQKQCFFYIYDITWYRNKYHYRDLENIYCNENLKLICKTEEQKHIIKNCWQRESLVLQEPDPKLLIELLEKNYATKKES